MVGITGYSPEAETDKAETQDNGGNANTGGNGGDGDGLNNLGFADWSLPPTLLSLLRMQGEPNDGFFLDFIRRALQQNVDEDNIIKACLHGQSPYDGSIYKHVRNCGGEDFVKRVIASIVSELPEQTERKVILVAKRGAITDKYWREVEEALIEKKCPVFVRNKRLVWPCWRWHKVADGDNERNVLSAELETYSLVQLADMVQHHAVQFKLWDGRIHDYRDIDPPLEIIARLHDARHYKLSDIVGVITGPTIRADGSLLTEPGYDEQTELWYKPSDNVQLPPIPDAREDAVKALALINGVFDEFPFEGAVDKEGTVSRSAALAGLMTTVAIGALTAAVPQFVVTANKGRSGKTYLVNLISAIATGHIPVQYSGSRTQEEFEKRVETAALASRGIMHFNNLPKGTVVESERLAELSTEREVTIRKLGRHEEGKCNCRATVVFLNGNNILMGGDLVPRTVTCRLNANMEHPEERKFAEPKLIEHVRANRGAYLAAVFTIIRAFRAAGSPEQKCKCVTGFEQWSRLVQQALIWLDEEDPWGTIEEMRAMDPQEDELQRLHDVLKKYSDQLAGRFTVADCTKLAEATDGFGHYRNQDLRELMTNRGKLDGQYFGRMLMDHRDELKDGWRIEVLPSGVRTKAFRLANLQGHTPVAKF